MTTTIDLADRAERNPMIDPSGSLYPVSDVLEPLRRCCHRVESGRQRDKYVLWRAVSGRIRSAGHARHCG
jgi:hypothetical protein